MRFADGLLFTLSLTCGLPERPVSYAHIFICGPMVAPRVRMGPKWNSCRNVFGFTPLFVTFRQPNPEAVVLLRIAFGGLKIDKSPVLTGPTRKGPTLRPPESASPAPRKKQSIDKPTT